VPIPDDVVARYRERFARQLPGSPSYKDIADRVRRGELPPTLLERLHRWADHDATWETLVSQHGRAKAAVKMEKFWLGKGDIEALDAAAQAAYGKRYGELCCAERRAVTTVVAAQKLEAEGIAVEKAAEEVKA
jgi:hypothetical protein